MTPERLNDEPLPEGFRMTELGALPAHWKVVKLGEIFTLVNKKDRVISIEDEDTYRLITVKLYAKGIILRSEDKGSKIGTKVLYRVKGGDFVFSKIDARNGAWGFIPPELDGGLVSGDFPILQLYQKKASNHFIEFLLSRPCIWEPLRNVSIGTTNRKRLQVKNFLDVPIPLPPLEEQQEIAHALRTVQEARDAAAGVAAALRELKRSLMRHLFAYGPIPPETAGRLPLQDTELGALPAHWKVVKLGEVANFNRQKSVQNQSRAKQIPFIPMSLIPEDSLYITNWELRSFNEIRSGIPVSEGDLLVAKITPCLENGKQGIVLGIPNGWGFATTEVIPIRPFSNLNLEFLAFYLKVPDIRKNLATKMEGTTGRQRLPKSILADLPIPLPPLEEQQEIARILQAVDAKIAAEESRQQALEALFQSLLHHLMTGKVRVPPTLEAPHASCE